MVHDLKLEDSARALEHRHLFCFRNSQCLSWIVSPSGGIEASKNWYGLAMIGETVDGTFKRHFGEGFRHNSSSDRKIISREWWRFFILFWSCDCSLSILNLVLEAKNAGLNHAGLNNERQHHFTFVGKLSRDLSQKHRRKGFSEYKQKDVMRTLRGIGRELFPFSCFSFFLFF